MNLPHSSIAGVSPKIITPNQIEKAIGPAIILFHAKIHQIAYESAENPKTD
jgi:hypothetical protein